MCDKVSPPTPSGKASPEGKAESGKLKAEIGKASPCTQSAFGGADAEVGSEQDKITSKGKIMSKTEVDIGNEVRSGQAEEDGAPVEGEQRAEDSKSLADGDGMKSQRADPPSSENYGGLGEEGREQRSEARNAGDTFVGEGALGERQTEIVAGPEAPQPPAGNAEGTGVAGNAPKQESLPGGEIPEREKEPWRYDPYEVSRKIREAEKARRMRRRQIEM
jgi:hypothetical protein